MKQTGNDLEILLPEKLSDTRDTVVVVDFTGALRDSWQTAPAIVSQQFNSISVDAARAELAGHAAFQKMTSSWYFGNWKHDTCVHDMRTRADAADFSCRFIEPGDYRIILDYACPPADKDCEGIVEIGHTLLNFESLLTGEYSNREPLLFFHHNVGIVSVREPVTVTVSVRPKNDGEELFWLRRISFEPIE